MTILVNSIRHIGKMQIFRHDTMCLTKNPQLLPEAALHVMQHQRPAAMAADIDGGVIQI